MSHKKAGGSTRLGRDSQSKRLGVKVHDGQIVRSGMVIVRQRGTRIHAGANVRRGGDDTLYALMNGIVKFTRRQLTRFDGNRKITQLANVVAK